MCVSHDALLLGVSSESPRNPTVLINIAANAKEWVGELVLVVAHAKLG